MADNNLLKDAIRAVIKENGNQEITGSIMQSALISIINHFGNGGVFRGVAVPTTNPGLADVNAFYVAVENGTYANFGGYVNTENKFVMFSNLGSGNYTKIFEANIKGKDGQAFIDVWSTSSPSYPYQNSEVVRDVLGNVFISLKNDNSDVLTDKTSWLLLYDREYLMSLKGGGGDSQTYNISNFTRYVGFSGSTVGGNVTPVEGEGALYSITIPVSGDYESINIATIGGGTRRRWYFLNDLVILSVGVADSGSGGATLAETLIKPSGANRLVVQVWTDNLAINNVTLADISVSIVKSSGTGIIPEMQLEISNIKASINTLNSVKADKGGSIKTLKQVDDTANLALSTIDSIYSVPVTENFDISSFTQAVGFVGTTQGAVVTADTSASLRSITISDLTGISKIEIGIFGGGTRRRWYFLNNSNVAISIGAANSGNGGGAPFDEVLTTIPTGATKLVIQSWSDNYAGSGKTLSDVYVRITKGGAGDKLINQIESEIQEIQEEIEDLKNGDSYDFIAKLMVSNNAMCFGASGIDANAGNTWFESACAAIGVTAINKARAGTNSMYLANALYNLSQGNNVSGLPVLLTKAEFESADCFFINYVHNVDAFTLSPIVVGEVTFTPDQLRGFKAVDYETNNIIPYTGATTDGSWLLQNYKAAAYDYNIKKIYEICYNLKDDSSSPFFNVVGGKPVQIAFVTFWDDTRTIISKALRELSRKWNIPIVPIDKMVGFTTRVPNPANGQNIRTYYTTDGTHILTGSGQYIQKKLASIISESIIKIS